MHNSNNSVCTCNLPSLECFEDNANPPFWSAGKAWADLGVSSLLLVGSHHLFASREKDEMPFQVIWGLYNRSLVQHLENFPLY